MALIPGYAELHCVSNFTFLRGASQPEELVARAHELGYGALAITDECSFAGVVRAHAESKTCGLKFLIGTELQLEDGPRLVLLATDRESYGNLSELITRGRRQAEKGSYLLRGIDLDGLTAGCLALLVPSRYVDYEHVRWVAERFPGCAWIATELLRGPDDSAWLERLQELSSLSGLPLVAAGDVHMHVRTRQPLQDTMTAIRIGRPVKDCGLALYPNGERHLRTREMLADIYPPELLAETLAIAERSNFSLDSLRYEYPEEIVPAGQTPASYLRQLTEAGLERRFPAGVASHVRDLIEHELTLIAELRYEPYFLTVYDVVRFAREHGILCQGRGSAANSAVCYALGITEVDPARMSMLFERFISKERNEPPDIDVDFEHQRREEVIQYIYGKYGRDRAALTATVITYRPKSAVRDVGKALGLDLAQVDRLAKTLAWWDGSTIVAERVKEVGLNPDSAPIRHLLKLVPQLIGFPRHLSQHTGGFVIARGKLSRLVPIENAAMPERCVIQWDKDDLEALGLLKIDVLALGMLSAIRRALEMVSAYHGHLIRMQDVPAEDPAVYEMIGHSDTVGVFQIESRAQMAMLPRLKPRKFFDLVIEVAIVRPGPIQGGMVHPYLRRRNGDEPVSYPSQAVRDVLERTLGVPIFQEQVMQLAIVAAGFTPGEADRLRRAMAAWKRRGGLEPFEKRLKDGMRERGYSDDFADQIFRQILGFGEYGFPESHSASFALLVYVSCWLKHYHPAAFTAALLNSQPMGFYAPSQLVQDARRHGVEVRPVDVLVSDWDCTLELGADGAAVLRLGLRMVKGLSEKSAQRLVMARAAEPIASVDVLARRANLDRRDLHALAAADAFASLAGHRRRQVWAVTGVEQPTGVLREAPIVDSVPLLVPPSEAENMVADFNSLGLTLGRHPVAMLRPQLQRLRLQTAAQIRELQHGKLARTAGIVIGRQRPDTASGVIFVTLEDETGTVNVVVWNSVAQQQRRALLGSTLLQVRGTVEREGEVVHVLAGKLIDLSAMLGELSVRSRDFH